ncbi:hypothetical protein GCK72_010623 [Caenorhabditis remanei]|uniref:Uncharacterized protein n=1 Tax=Caenorhabditis remanei TaxID=31234 RepID=A0A6A5H5Z3_CAERE|nr:hypothetical protein GCK72_010623 [Caenorhabditis remanei]KAF1762361.1 hypothetical protein GCK72_010623 [Caenorhabditis remanei]
MSVLQYYCIWPPSVPYFTASEYLSELFISLQPATTAVFQAAVQSEGPFKCDVEHCQPIINIVMCKKTHKKYKNKQNEILVSIIAISFIIPIITLSFVLVTLYCYKNRAESIGSFTADASAYNSARTRLAWTLFTFTLISLSEAIPASYMVGIKVDGSITTCVNFYQADHLIVPAIMNSFQGLAWFVSIFGFPFHLEAVRSD